MGNPPDIRFSPEAALAALLRDLTRRCGRLRTQALLGEGFHHGRRSEAAHVRAHLPRAHSFSLRPQNTRHAPRACAGSQAALPYFFARTNSPLMLLLRAACRQGGLRHSLRLLFARGRAHADNVLVLLLVGEMYKSPSSRERGTVRACRAARARPDPAGLPAVLTQPGPEFGLVGPCQWARGAASLSDARA